MANTIQQKRSSVAGKIPTSANLAVGEIAINFPDRIIYTKDATGNIVIIGGGNIGALADVSNTTPSNGQVLYYDINTWVPSSLTTSNVTEGTNQYFTNARVYANVNTIGFASNSYVNTRLATKANVTDLNTSNVTEGTNQYFTNARVYANVVNIGYSSNSFVVSQLILKANVADLNTSNIAEGTNLYFTNARVRLALTSGNTISYSNITGNITLTPSGVTATTYGGSSNIPIFTVDQFGRITSASNVAVAGVNGFTASGNSFTISTGAGTTFIANIQPNSVRLGTDTTGDYLSNVLAGTGVTITNQGGEGASPTIAIGQSVSTSSDVTFANVTVTGKLLSNDITSSNITIDGDAIVTGNLIVAGNTTTLNSQSLLIADNQIVLNSNQTGIPALDAGILVNRGSSSNVDIKWNEVTDRWQYTNDGINYYNLPTTTTDVPEGANLYYQNARVKAYLAVFDGNIVPVSNSLYNLGSQTLRWKDLYLSGTTIDLGGTLLTSGADGLTVTSANITTLIGNSVTVGYVTSNVWNNIYTDNVVERSNLYFTNTRSYANTLAAIKTGNGIVYNNVTGNITLSPTGVGANTFGGNNTVPYLVVNEFGRITSAANVALDKVSAFTASGNSLTIQTSTGNSFTANIQLNSIRLGLDTSGDYVSNITAGTGVSITNNGGEGINPTVSIGQNVSTSANVTFNNVQVPNAVVANIVYANAYQNLYTSNVIENTNLYFTNARSIAALSEGQNIRIESNGRISTNNLYALQVQLVDGANTVSATVGNVRTLQFNSDSGFDLIDRQNGIAKVEINSTFKTWNVLGQANLVATGLDVVRFVPNPGIQITTNAAGVPYKTISFEANVKSVNGQIGDVVLTTSNISESTNLYFNNDRVYANVVLLNYASNTYVNTQLSTKANVSDLNTSNVTEGTNQYFTNARVYANVSTIGYAPNAYVNDRLATKANISDLTTSNVVEGTNLYFTNARVYANVVNSFVSIATNQTVTGTKTFSGGIYSSSNSYNFGTAPVDGSIYYVKSSNTYGFTKGGGGSDVIAFTPTGITIDGVSTLPKATGSTNLYLRADGSWATIGTSNIIEDTNLFYTNARVYAAVTGNLALKANVTDLTTSNVAEGSNLYYTNTRGRYAISTTGNLSYNNTTGIINYITPSPEINVSLTGDVAGYAVANLTYLNSNTISITTVIQPNSVILGADTSGEYVRNIAAGNSIIITNNGGENSFPTISTTQLLNENSSPTFYNLTVSGNLNVIGNVTYISSNVFEVNDPLIYLAGNNYFSDIVDIGFVGNYYDGVLQRHAGLFRDASDNGTFKLFANLNPEPTDIIDTANASFRYANIQVGLLYGNVIGTVSSLVNQTTTGLAEGTNLYYTNARVYANVSTIGYAPNAYVNDRLSIKANVVDLTTSNVTEGTNLYFTNTRARAALSAGDNSILYDSTNGTIRANVAALGANVLSVNGQTGIVQLSTFDISESGNLYFTNARVYANISPLLAIKANIVDLTTSNVTEGTNLYFTNTRVYANISPLLTTANISEVTNQYFTNARVYANVSTIGYAPNSFVTSQLAIKANVADLTTSNVVEGTNLYFTNARVYSNVISLLPNYTGNIGANNIVGISANTFIVSGSYTVIFDNSGNVQVPNALRANVLFANTIQGITTSNVAEGTNLYFTNSRVYANISPLLTTANVSEVTNLYYTNARVYAAVTGNLALKANVTDLTTSNVTEGTNLYYTNTRGRYAITSGNGISYSNATGNLGLTSTGVVASTYGANKIIPVISIDEFGRIGYAANVALGTINLGVDTTGSYLSNVLAGTGVTITNQGGAGATPTIVIGQNVATTADVTFGNVTVNGKLLSNDITATSIIIDGNAVITGNLTVSGNTFIINAEEIYLADNQIVLNSNHSGSPTQDAGILINRGLSANVDIKWNETNDKWTFTNDGTTYYNLPTSTTDLAEGTNLYYTNNRVYAAVTGNLALKANVVDLTTSNVSEGTNLYFTNARVYSNVSPLLTTANVTEVNNLYFTNARVYSNVISLLPSYTGNVGGNLIGTGTNTSIISGTYTFTFDNSGNVQIPGAVRANVLFANIIQGITTSNITEGTNLYFTNARVVAAISAGNNITIDANGRINSTATGGGGSGTANIAILDEGTYLTNTVTSINFVGAAVTSTNTGNNVTITISNTVGSPTTVELKKFTYTATASQSVFTGADDLGKTLSLTDSSNAHVFLNGLLLTKTNDYTINNSTVTLQAPVIANSVVSVLESLTYVNSVTVGNVKRYTYTTTNGQTIFTGADNTGNVLTLERPENAHVFLNGILLTPVEDYNSYTGNVTLSEAATANSTLTIVNTYIGISGFASNAFVEDYVNSKLTTANVSEVTNLYYTNARARYAITSGNGISYSNATGNLGLVSTSVTPSTYGGATQIPSFVVDQFGRLTSVSNVAVSSSSGTVDSAVVRRINYSMNFIFR